MPYPWKQGDDLTAADLNAAIANASAGGTALLAALVNAANDTAAAAAGVAVGQLYRNGNFLMVRIS